MAHKALVNYSIDSKLLEKFDKKKGIYKKSNLVEFWISEFIKNKKEFIPPRVNSQTSMQGGSNV